MQQNGSNLKKNFACGPIGTADCPIFRQQFLDELKNKKFAISLDALNHLEVEVKVLKIKMR